MAKSKFFRIAVEGETVDGRVIERKWLEQMAASYDPKTYTARINCEHIAGYSPDKPFNAYGTILALRTAEVELQINGQTVKKLALEGEIEANDQLLAINKAGQKLFTSCEIHPNFADSGKAYLVGLAVTDQPASLGTEPLKFAAMARPNLFTTALETSIELTAETLEQAGLVDAIKNGIATGLASLFSREEKPGEAAAKPKEQQQPANDNAFDVSAFATVMGNQIAAAVKPANDAIAGLNARFDALDAKLANTEHPGTFTRTPATGGSGAVVTDC
ncbi:GPO family capsid scaffolding protein [Sphingobium sp. B11D3A]|uniref:GPO family capsid scaffolding protein n=1 Tax=Sphingobium sp. B11D3A TaxID=2940574 RepID=UPI002223EFFC|nr:GPO family capsid scaffolding protein [Sphingobium sp. B11D3A]MCW2391929.1 hypothetical protein [Sphingobium sp. B11D3A]